MQMIMLRNEEMSFQTTEAFKNLRSNIEFCGSDVHTIAITSATPNEGKSSVCLELAKAFAQNNSKVLLIDADIRKSNMQSHFEGATIHYGLSNLLVGKCRLKDCVFKTNLPNFYIMFSGPVTPTPSELLGSQYFAKLLEQAQKHFDYVIVDTPPLGSVIDSAIVGRQCDGCVLVISSGAISYRFVQRVQQQMERAQCKILGCVLNQVDLEAGGGYSGYRKYGKYYSRYYGRQYG